MYNEWNAGGVNAFVEGGGALMNEGLGIPTSLSATILATMAVLFAATTMDTGVRLQRFVVAEIGEIMGFKLKTWVATVIVLAVTMGLAFGAGADGSGGMVIWPLFGTTNQLMAALTLSIICSAVSACSLGSSVSPVSLVPDLRTSHPAFTQSLQYAWGVFGSSNVPRSTAKSSAMSW